MPLFQIDIEKRSVNESWTNRYIINAPDLAQGTQTAGFFVTAEQTFHLSTTQFVALRVRSFAEGDDQYTITPLSGVGAVAAEMGTVLPFFNVVRVDLTAQVGRPSRKYYRGCLDEARVAGGNIDPSYLSLVQGALEPLLSGTQWVDPDGDPLVGVVPKSAVAMRQLRRGSRRRTQPILTGP